MNPIFFCSVHFGTLSCNIGPVTSRGRIVLLSLCFFNTQKVFLLVNIFSLIAGWQFIKESVALLVAKKLNLLKSLRNKSCVRRSRRRNGY